MAEFKTAEQYVVLRCEELERKLEETEAKYTEKLLEVAKEYDKTKAELCEAYDLLNMFREFFKVDRSNYYGNYVHMENIYNTDHPEIFARVMEYYDMRPEENENE